jgi:hypothetical protein
MDEVAISKNLFAEHRATAVPRRGTMEPAIRLRRPQIPAILVFVGGGIRRMSAGGSPIMDAMPIGSLKLFLSYPSERLDQARRVHDFLKSIRVHAWFDKESLIGGQDWDRERANAQHEADLTVLICSPETVGRRGVIQREIKDALERCRDAPLGDICLIPIRTEDLKLPEELSRYHYIDLFREDWEYHLARGLRTKFERSSLAPPSELVAFVDKQEGEKAIASRILRSVDRQLEAESRFFLYLKKGEFWDFVNSEIMSTAVGGFLKSHFDARRFLRELERPGNWSLQIEQFFSVDEFVSLKCFEFANYGGAHPTRGIHTRNYDNSAGGKLDLGEIFGWNETVLNYLKEACERDVNRQLRAMDFDQRYSLDNYVRESIISWNVFSQWNISNQGLSIALSQFSELPFVMGVFEVLISCDFFKGKVHDDFRGTTLSRLIDEA